jgi:hypothetical protein
MTNQRNFNRIDLWNIVGDLILTTAEKDYNIIINIKNINAGGIGFEHELDFPLSKINKFKFRFKLDEEDFTISGIIKSKALTDGKNLYYSVQFVNVDKNEHQRLVKAVNLYEVRHFRFSKDEVDK